MRKTKHPFSLTVSCMLVALVAASCNAHGDEKADQSAAQETRLRESGAKLRRIQFAIHDLAEREDYRFPAFASFDSNRKPLLSWRVHLLPYLGEEELYQRFRLDEPWDSPHNKDLVLLMPEVYDSPGRNERIIGTTTYLLPVGKQALFHGFAEGVSLKNVLDGLSYTIMIVDVNERHAVIWTKPADLRVETTPIKKACQGRFPDKLLIGMADGSRCAFPEDTPARILEGMLTCAGGEPIEDDLVRSSWLRGLSKE